MLQEQMCRDITGILHKTMARSFLNEFASRLNININPGEAEQVPNASAGAVTNVEAAKIEKTLKTQLSKEVEQLKQGSGGVQAAAQKYGGSGVFEQQNSQIEQVPEKRDKPSAEDFDQSDPKIFAKQIKNLATVTPHDKHMHNRQKQGQLRIGDIICINYIDEIHVSDINMNKKKMEEAKNMSSLRFIGPEPAKFEKQKLFRTLAAPDYKYKGLLFSDGVTDQGIKILPQKSDSVQNAANLFKQCLFRIEIKQDCQINNRVRELQETRDHITAQIDQIISDHGGNEETLNNQKYLIALKKEVALLEQDLEISESLKQKSDENNQYEQNLQVGHKLTYGQPVQFKHLFSSKYLTLNMKVMSQEYGCCQMYLSETTDFSQFCIEPTFEMLAVGSVINYKDYFQIKSICSTTPFYFHIFKKPQDEFNLEKSFLLNASQEPTRLKAKLFMSHIESEKEKSFIQSGDVVRIRHEEANGYLTTSQINVDELLPMKPDFLQLQINRIHRNEKAELFRKIGGLPVNKLTEDEMLELEKVQGFEWAIVNDEYAKKLKDKATESVYIEKNIDRLLFTNSCWELQRVNQFKGGNLILDEVYRFRHVGTGKFLAVAENRKDLTLINTTNSLDTLFCFKSEMQTKKPPKFEDEEDEDNFYNHKTMRSHQRIMIMSYIDQKYLQLFEDLDDHENESFKNHATHVGEAFDQNGLQLTVINHTFQDQYKHKMLFYIEEVDYEKSVYSYKSGCIFDELLEFYAFLNVWAVTEVSGSDDIEMPSENYFYNADKGIDLTDEMFDKCVKIMYILENIDLIIKNVELDDTAVHKCKSELAEQGILDILCCILEMIYYKTTPLPLLQRPFVKRRPTLKFNEDGTQQEEINLSNVIPQDYVAEEIARDQLNDVTLKILDLVLNLIRAHRINSERCTRYFGILFQLFCAHEMYNEIKLVNPAFQCDHSHEFISLIGEILKRSQKNALYNHEDKSSSVLVEFNKKRAKGFMDLGIKGQLNKTGIQQKKRESMLGLDNRKAIKLIEFQGGNDTNQIQKWLDLLEPVKFINAQNQNLEKQILFLNIICMFCRNKEGEGVYPYQMQVIETIFEKDENIPMKFGCAKVGNILRPFVYFCRPKAIMSVGSFIERNPILGEIQDSFKMTQKSTNQYEMIFDIHELTKNYNTKGKETWPYIDYICAVINLYAHVCLSGNQRGIKAVIDTGIEESMILCCISSDQRRLVIHEKFKQVFMFLTRVMYIQNDAISPGISNKNRCYVWNSLQENRVDELGQAIDNQDIDSENNVENDFYAGLDRKKKTQMEDPNNSMVVLRKEQVSKDLALIRLIKKDVVWFLQTGPKGTVEFFEGHKKRNYNKNNLKVKIKSLKIYFETLYALVAEDCGDAKFISNVFYICQCAILGSKCLGDKQESYIPPIVKNTWVYIIMWHSKNIVNTTRESRELKNAIRALETKFLNILDKICDYRLNYQLQKALVVFRKFQELNLNPNVANADHIDVHCAFQELFSFFQLDTGFKLSDIQIYEQIMKSESPEDQAQKWNLPLSKQIISPMDYENKDPSHYMLNKKVPFDLFLLNFIFSNDSNHNVRLSALKVLLKNFTQRDLVIKELARTDIIVSNSDYLIYFNFIQKQRKLKEKIHKLIQDEMYHLIYKKQPNLATKTTKEEVMEILNFFVDQLNNANDVELRKMQNMIKHINLIDDLVNVLLKRLIYKELYYNDLFQKIIDFLFLVCQRNPNIQVQLLPDVNFFLDMMNMRVETGHLISEIIKSNKDEEFNKKFILYLSNLIFDQGYFKSTLINQLTRLAQGANNEDREQNYGSPQGGQIDDQRLENSNQQFIFKLCINQPKFRQILMMKKVFTFRKLGVIKTYAKKLEQYNLSKKAHDGDLQKDKEQMDLHLSIVRLVTACARNSPFGIAQAQKLIECEELLDSLLSDSIPYLVKKHYADLLYEVYLRKVPGLDEANRLSISDIKFIQIMKWVVLYDFSHCFNYYVGFVVEPLSTDSPEHVKKRKQVIREIERSAENEYDEMYIGKTEKDIDDERKFKAGLSQFKDSSPFYVFDTNDKTEFWRYIYEYKKAERCHEGILNFIEKFYRDYAVSEIRDENLQDVSVKLRDRLLQIANKLYQFVENHEDYIKPEIFIMLKQINNALLRIPQIRAFRVGKKRVVKNGIVQEVDDDDSQAADDSLNMDESRDQDNKLQSERILRILRDHIIKENQSVKAIFGVEHVSSDFFINKDELKDRIKGITKSEATYDDILKAITHFHKISFEKKQERQVMNVEPGQKGYIMDRNEGQSNLKVEIQKNIMNFKDFETILKEVLNKQGYKQPQANRDRDFEDPNAILKPDYTSDKDLSMAINVDLKLFTQKFFEFVHQTQNVSEIHDFANKLMISEFIDSFESKVQLVKNLCTCFKELDGIDDELTLISILSIILKRTMPEEDDSVDSLGNEFQKQIFRKKNHKLQVSLKEWQKVMFEAEVPQLMFEFIDVHEDHFLASKAMSLINLIIARPTEYQQQSILQLLKRNDDYFRVFFYIKTRMQISKNFLIQRIKFGAKDKFVEKRLQRDHIDSSYLSNDFKIQNVYMNQKFELEQKYDELATLWKQDEIITLLDFLNLMCEGCYRESQNYLRDQFEDSIENFKDIKQGKITSIDLIYEVVSLFIDIVDELGFYVYADFRTYKLIPLLLDTLIEFIYGPNIQNQMFLGRWKKLIIVLNFLMRFKETGNYSGIHQEAKAQLKILNSCSNILLAIVDIKDKEKAKEIHHIILNEIDVQNLRDKMVDIYLFKIGGSDEKKRVYEYDIICNHYNQPVKQEEEQCIENEFCRESHLIPRDKETIQTGFNIFQILQILQTSCPNHPKMASMIIDKNKKDFLWKDYGKFYVNIHKTVTESYSAKSTAMLFIGFNMVERNILDNMIIKCFPEVYLKYLETITPKEDDQANLLNQILQQSQDSKTSTDLSKILEKVQIKIQNDINKEMEKKALGGNQLFIDLELQNVEEDYFNNADDQQRLIQSVNLGESMTVKKKQGVLGFFKQNFNNYNKVSTEVDYTSLSKEQKRETTIFNREEFVQKLKLFKFYLSHQFYQDNIGRVEIMQADDQIIETTFKMPAYVNLLTKSSRKEIPLTIFGVSQQEKLEAFMSTIPLLKVEMLYQQELGKLSSSLKKFVNNSAKISWVNFIIIIFTNLLFINTLIIDQLDNVSYDQYWQYNFVKGISIIQTSVSITVTLAYYIDNMKRLKFQLKKAETSPEMSVLKLTQPRYLIGKLKKICYSRDNKGTNKGSQGFGAKKCEKVTSIKQINFLSSSFERFGQLQAIGYYIVIAYKEIFKFIKCTYIDHKHLMNCIYVLISIYSISDDFFCSLLLIDILNKIPALSHIYSIFTEQASSLMSTLALFLVMLYIAAFYSFLNFHEDFEAVKDPDDWYYDKHAPDFNMYCGSLGSCFLSTANVGIRAGGGLGDAITQRSIDDPQYLQRYSFDLGFFLIINLILLNIFFGIIIDAFADKRALLSEEQTELENQCFICGISKSQFDIENIPWKDHIYCQHNMHSYLAFILYVMDKPVLECTGVEKHVKQKIKDGVIEFYPVNRCLAIKNGELVEE